MHRSAMWALLEALGTPFSWNLIISLDANYFPRRAFFSSTQDSRFLQVFFLPLPSYLSRICYRPPAN